MYPQTVYIVQFVPTITAKTCCFCFDFQQMKRTSSPLCRRHCNPQLIFVYFTFYYCWCWCWFLCTIGMCLRMCSNQSVTTCFICANDCITLNSENSMKKTAKNRTAPNVTAPCNNTRNQRSTPIMPRMHSQSQRFIVGVFLFFICELQLWFRKRP